MRKKNEVDAAFEHDVRFHVSPNGKLQKGEVMVCWPAPKDEICAVVLRFDEVWPASIDVSRVSAAFVKSRDQINEAIAFIAANKNSIRH